MPASSNAALRKAPKKSKKKPAASAAPQKREEVHEGDNVRLDGSTTVGKVLQIQGTQALVAFGMLKTTVDVARLRPTIAKVQSGAGKASFISASTTENLRNRQLDFKQEIDVRGMRPTKRCRPSRILSMMPYSSVRSGFAYSTAPAPGLCASASATTSPPSGA